MTAATDAATPTRADQEPATRRRWSQDPALRLAVVAAVIVFATRAPGLTRSLWLDEAYTAWAYVLRGPDTIRDPNAYLPNNHVLFSWLTWRTSTVLGLGEPALRTWALLPAVGATGWLTGWLARREGMRGAWVAVAVVAVTVTSPLHAAWSTEVRGYDLVLLASTVLLTSSVDAVRRRRWRDDIALVLAGAVGVATLPSFALLAGTSGLLVLAARRAARWARLAGLAAGAGALVLWWYGPLLPAIAARRTTVGARWGEPATPWTGLVDAPWLLVGPSLGGGAVAGLAATLLVAIGALALVRARRRAEAALLSGAVVGTGVAFAAAGIHVLPRYLALLLPHLLLLAAVGAVAAVVVVGRHLHPHVRVPLATSVVVVLLASQVGVVDEELRTPRQDFAGLQAFLRDRGVTSVVATDDHAGLRFYLRDPTLEVVPPGDDPTTAACPAAPGRAFVPALDGTSSAPPCLELGGHQPHRLRHRSAPGHLEVWTAP